MGCVDTSILYLTDNALAPEVRDTCIRHLQAAAGDVRVVSVSQAPVPLGLNINLGPIGRSGRSMYKQILAGLEQITTPFVAIAEHDCLYTKEHFQFVPPDDDFWYNDNCWLLQYHNPNFPEKDGMFSFYPKRQLQSQMVCRTDQLRQATQEQLAIVSMPEWDLRRKDWPIGEPGVASPTKTAKISRGFPALQAALKDFTTKYTAKTFYTKQPNIDVRHGGNWTGPRRGIKRRLSLPPWGTMQDIFNGGVRGL